MLTAGVTVFFGDQNIHCFQKGRLVRSTVALTLKSLN